METKSVTTKTQAHSSFHESFIRRSSSWKIRLFPKPVGRIPKTLCFSRATVSRHSFCSCFKSESHQIKDMKRTLQRIAQSCLEFNAEAIFVGLDKIMQMHKHFSRSVNYLSRSCHPFTQSDLDTRGWYHGMATTMECLQALLCTPSLPDCSRPFPLTIDYTCTQLVCPKPKQEPVRRLGFFAIHKIMKEMLCSLPKGGDLRPEWCSHYYLTFFICETKNVNSSKLGTIQRKVKLSK